MDKTFEEKALHIFRKPARIIIAGYTNSGKTHLCTKIVEKYEDVFSRIIICGVTSHPLQSNMKLNHKVEVHEEIISIEPTPYTNPHAQTLLILDDNFLSSANSQAVANSFIKGRHLSLSVIFIAQSLFFPGKYSRTIALNASHYILMKSRDIYQVQCLGRQIFGREDSKKFAEVYKNTVLKREHGYLLCDLAPHTPLELQLRTNIVGEPPCEKVFLL